MNINREVESIFNRGKVLNITKPTDIYDLKEYKDGVFRVKSGAVKVFINQGKNCFFIDIGLEGDIIGIEAVFNGNKHNKSYVPIKNTELEYIPASDFFTEINKNQKLFAGVLQHLSERSDELESRILGMQHKSVTKNFAELLLTLSKTNIPNIIPSIITTSDVANLIGTTKNYIYKTIQKLENRNVISFKDRKLRIINKTLLKKIVSDKDED